ncbi:hypothetical protein TNCV_2915501 [Trichonephila clavipes]|nr:hypothetical protein TNCV_2915501 [Trichonephila clavipes]
MGIEEKKGDRGESNPDLTHIYVTLGAEVHEIFRSGGRFDVKFPVFSSQASLVLIYRPIEVMKGRVYHVHPGIRAPNLRCESVERYNSVTGFTTIVSVLDNVIDN